MIASCVVAKETGTFVLIATLLAQIQNRLRPMGVEKKNDIHYSQCLNWRTFSSEFLLFASKNIELWFEKEILNFLEHLGIWTNGYIKAYYLIRLAQTKALA